ncbi:MAG: ATP-grasp domain-containing protein [Nevskia sp.]|nr:ATP-grasp domain-containing protein [Nevskia sp.]
MTPRILLTTTLRWPLAARLAIAFARLGCQVTAICPSEHPVACLRGFPQPYRYSLLRPLHSLRRAIEHAAPDLVIPCDDDAAVHLHRLHQALRAGGASATADLIERSLGAPAACELATARGQLADVALQEGLRVPATRVVASEGELDAWIAGRDFPAVLKCDHSWGGLGVSIVRNPAEAHHAFRQMAARPSLARTLLRTTLDRDPSQLLKWIGQRQRTVSVQDHVRGMPANRAVACWRGQVLAGISVEALNTLHQTGPATVVRVIDHDEMAETAARLVRRLGLSGLWGFDFVLDAAHGAAWLIEVNPRATPICHLPLRDGRDLPAALFAQLAGSPAVAPAVSLEAREIAMFPGEWRRDPASRALHAAYHDVPWEEPELVRSCIGLTWEERGLLARFKSRVHPRRAPEPVDARVPLAIGAALPPRR